jgi:hypothetical protein
MPLHYLVPVVLMALCLLVLAAYLAASAPGPEQEISMEAARTDKAAVLISCVELRTRRLPRISKVTPLCLTAIHIP